MHARPQSSINLEHPCCTPRPLCRRRRHSRPAALIQGAPLVHILGHNKRVHGLYLGSWDLNCSSTQPSTVPTVHVRVHLAIEYPASARPGPSLPSCLPPCCLSFRVVNLSLARTTGGAGARRVCVCLSTASFLHFASKRRAVVSCKLLLLASASQPNADLLASAWQEPTWEGRSFSATKIFGGRIVRIWCWLAVPPPLCHALLMTSLPFIPSACALFLWLHFSPS